MSSSAHLIQMFDSTIVRACVGRRSKGGQEVQALGRSRGGFTTKIHAKSDASGDIIAFDLGCSCQTATAPFVSCQRISEVSPLKKAPVHFLKQLGPGSGSSKPWSERVVPFAPVRLP
jgi:hypothetical protein